MPRNKLVTLAATLVIACGEPPIVPDGEIFGTAPPNLSCQFLTQNLFSSGSSRDGIPSLVDPVLVPASHADAQYVDTYASRNPPVEVRVVGMVVDGVAIAIPYNVLVWHEIVNIDIGGRRVAVSFCPLTGSAIVFDATAAGTERFGVSGLIYRDNLVMFDVETGSLWPQMCLGASLGDRQGTKLVQVPATDMLWQTWKTRYSETLVVSSQTGWDRDYTQNAYESYELSDVLFFSSPDSVDKRRPMKERVVGIADGNGGLAIPFGVMEAAGNLVVFRTSVGEAEIQILWDGEARTARVFHQRTGNGQVVALRTENGSFVDIDTGSAWNLEGRALAGPMAGATLVAHEASFIAYWFAWAAFYPDTRLWTTE